MLFYSTLLPFYVIDDNKVCGVKNQELHSKSNILQVVAKFGLFLFS